MSVTQWPNNFNSIPEEEWTKSSIGELAEKYDTVEEHGWYDNLNPTVNQIAQHHGSDDIILDYSGGTGILTDRVFKALSSQAPHVLIADSSPKFLRLALEKCKTNPKVAFRLIKYFRRERRLQNLRECIDPSIWQRGLDAVVSTNAIHLYYGLEQTIADWFAILKPGGRIYVQSGNIRNPSSPQGSWIIDETVEHIHHAAIDIVQSRSEYANFRTVLGDKAYMDAHNKLRKKYFLPVRDLAYYEDIFTQGGFALEPTQTALITARVDDWYDFIAVYHEGALGWIGGAQKITGIEASEEIITIRKQVMREAMTVIFSGAEEFFASWTYFQGVLRNK